MPSMMVSPPERPDPVRVRPYAGEAEAWDEFIHQQPGATFFHQIGWQTVLEDSFGFHPRYLVAWQGPRICGVLPLFEVNAPLMPKCLLSTPFAVEGGVCSPSAEAQQALARSAAQLCDELDAAFVELRDDLVSPEFRPLDVADFRFRRRLSAAIDENYASTPARRRYSIRAAKRKGVRVTAGTNQLAAFHHLYARTVRYFGTPVFPRRYFSHLLETFPNNAELLIARHEGTPVAGMLLLYFGEVATPYYVGQRRDAFHLNVSELLYFEGICSAAARGARSFDFGRSRRGSGAYRFKQLWDLEPEPIRYRTYSPKGVRSPRTGPSPRLDLAKQVWRRLPLPVTKLLGPPIVSRYGPYFT